MKFSPVTAMILVMFLLLSAIAFCGCTSPATKSTTSDQVSSPPTSETSVPPSTTAPAVTSQSTPPTPTTTTPTPTPTPVVIQTSASLKITSPQDGSSVNYRTTIKGTSSGVYGTANRISIVIQPHESGEYWVQPAVTVMDNGEWSTLTYFGRDATSTDSGKAFTVYAVISTLKFTEGKITQKPDGIKQMIEVTRS